MPRVSFAPRSRSRYAVLIDGKPWIKGGKQQVVKACCVAATRRQILNAGRRSPPPTSDVAEGHYDRFWRETNFRCPACQQQLRRSKRFTGTITCHGMFGCGKKFRVQLH